MSAKDMRIIQRWNRQGIVFPRVGWLRCLPALAVFACSVAAHAEKGIVVWKEQRFHKDDLARAFVFDRMKSSPEITWFYMGSERMGFEKNRFFEYLSVPPALPPELAEPEQFASYRQQFAELNAFASRFPEAARILKSQLEVMRGVITDYEAGQVYFSGEWMPRADYEARVAERDKLLRETAALRQAEREKQAALLEAERRKEARRQLALERAEGRRYAYAYGFGLVLYLILLVTAIVRRMGRLLVMLILAPLLAAGSMTYHHGGLDWMKRHAEKISHSWKMIEPPE